jgi:hypothetical protein
MHCNCFLFGLNIATVFVILFYYDYLFLLNNGSNIFQIICLVAHIKTAKAEMPHENRILFIIKLSFLQIMNRLLIALCVFGLVTVAFAKPSGGRGGPQKGKGGPGGQKGGKGGREGGRGADLVCEVTSDTFSMTKVCVEGECSLGPRLSVDRDGNQVSTKFCDAVNENGTSLVVSVSACVSTSPC